MLRHASWPPKPLRMPRNDPHRWLEQPETFAATTRELAASRRPSLIGGHGSTFYQQPTRAVLTRPRIGMSLRSAARRSWSSRRLLKTRQGPCFNSHPQLAVIVGRLGARLRVRPAQMQEGMSVDNIGSGRDLQCAVHPTRRLLNFQLAP